MVIDDGYTGFLGQLAQLVQHFNLFCVGNGIVPVIETHAAGSSGAHGGRLSWQNSTERVFVIKVWHGGPNVKRRISGDKAATLAQNSIRYQQDARYCQYVSFYILNSVIYVDAR